MADIATLGIAIKSDQVDKGAASLDRLSASAKRAEAATSGVSGASKVTSAANAAVTTSANSAAVALNKEAVAATKTSAALRAANTNARGMGGSMSGLAAQLQDVGVTAAAGLNPMIIGLQQGTQIAGQMEMALQSGASASSVFGAALKSLISPVSLLSIGITVLLAAGLQMVDWASVASGALNLLATAIDAIRPYAIAAAGALALLYAPAIISGIGTVIRLMGVLSLSALRAAASFTAAWLAALGPAGWFILGLAAVATAIYVFRDQIKDVFGVDVVAAVKDGTNAVIGIMVGAYDGIIAAWNMLPAAIGDLGYQAADRFYSAVTQMLRDLRAEINSFIVGINAKLGTSIPTIGGGLVGLNADGTQRHIANPYAGSASKAADAFSAAFAADQGKDYVGMIGKGISDMTSGAAEKLRSLAGSIGGVEEAAKKAGSAGKAAGDKIKEGAKAAADKMSEAAQTAKGFLSTLRQGLMQGKSLWESFGDAALGVLDKIMDKAETALANALFPSSGGGLFGGGGGFFGSILGGIGKLFGFASGGYTGGGAASSVAGVVHGGEYVFSKRATDRIGVSALDQLHRQAKGYAGGGHVTPTIPRLQAPANDSRVHVTVGVSVDKNGNLQAYVKDVAQKEAGQVSTAAIGQYDAGMPGRINDVLERHG